MTAHELVARCKDLKIASQAALQLVSLLDQPEASNEGVVEILKFDNVLTAKLLRACNSSAFGFGEPVASVDQAVFLLGHQQILQLVLTLEFSSTMVVQLTGYAVEAKELWHHSLATASAAEVIAKGGLDMEVDVSVAFTAGLLHDIGKLVMNQTLTPEWQTEIRSLVSTERISRAAAEKRVLGTDHAEAGAVLLESWKLPAEIVEAVRNHHCPVLEPRPLLSAVTHLADVAAHLAGSAPGWEAYAFSVDQHVAERFDFTPEKIESLVITVRESFDHVEEMMNMS